MKNVIFIASPAAGKGTLSKFLVENYQYIHISTGALFREKCQLADEEGQELKKILASGQLVDDERTTKILKEKLITLSKEHSFILDGYPRNINQAKALDFILKDLGFSDYVVIYLHINEEILKRRIIGRRICKNCQSTYNLYFDKFKPQKDNICDKCGYDLIGRAEDNEETFQVRYQIFLDNNEELIKFYQEQHRLFEIDNSNENHEETLWKLERIVGAKID